MTGMVTSAVRETMTNIMFASKAQRYRAEQQRKPDFSRAKQPR